jgi:hypothetical protein
MTREQELKRLIEELKVIRSNTKGPHSKLVLTETINVLLQVLHSLATEKDQGE